MNAGSKLKSNLVGKGGLIMGVANDHSIAWGMARSCTNTARNWRSRTKTSLQQTGCAARGNWRENILQCDASKEEDLDPFSAI